jgi:hypothetical protein
VFAPKTDNNGFGTITRGGSDAKGHPDMKLLATALTMTLFVGSLTAQKPAPSDNQTMKSLAMTTLKLVDDYKADAEKTGKTDVPTESQKRAELAINKLANVTFVQSFSVS